MYYQLECNRRGFYQVGPLVMETGDLFGLHRRLRVGQHTTLFDGLHRTSFRWPAMIWPRDAPLARSA